MEMLQGRLAHPQMDLALSHSTGSKVLNGIHNNITSDYLSVLDTSSQDVQTNVHKWTVGQGRDGNSGFLNTKYDQITHSEPRGSSSVNIVMGTGFCIPYNYIAQQPTIPKVQAPNN